jgi:hypothetical protein
VIGGGQCTTQPLRLGVGMPEDDQDALAHESAAGASSGKPNLSKMRRTPAKDSPSSSVYPKTGAGWFREAVEAGARTP